MCVSVCVSVQTDADPVVCKRMCRVNHSEPVLSLVSYYQMVRDSTPTPPLLFSCCPPKSTALLLNVLLVLGMYFIIID